MSPRNLYQVYVLQNTVGRYYIGLSENASRPLVQQLQEQIERTEIKTLFPPFPPVKITPLIYERQTGQFLILTYE
jgi:hypothetical protein